MKSVQPVKSPTAKELFTLRLMIVLGLASMYFFLRALLGKNIGGYAPLYWMLIITIVFNCLKIIHEWIHYLYITVPETPPHEKIYTVDIFTTFCAGEPYDMIVETLNAIQAIKYPHKTYLCDEADDPYLRNVCKELGIFHVTRTVKINAKAGNINNALKQSSGDLCVVLDPDHVPFPDFLDPIISHFNNPEVGFVQIVQAYRNHDEGLIAKGAAQQTFQFYGPIMMTMNKYGTVLAIGANCTFRRTALDSIGGHAAGLAEDMHTAMQLHAKGWKSVYVPAVLARGLVPTTLSAYYSQQLKWSRGVFELLVTSYLTLFNKFTWQQKLHYGVIPMHYLSGVIFLINFLIPIISLTFDISPINIDLSSFAIIGFPLVMAIILVRHFVQWWVMEDEERGFHVVGGLLMIGTWWIFVIGLYYTILRKKVPYNPTPKDGNEENNWPLNIPNLVVIALSIAAIIYGLCNDWSPYTLIMAGFAGMNCMILLFSVVASRQHQFRKLRERNYFVNNLMSNVAQAKKGFWKIRRSIYTGVRSTALLITIFTACLMLYFIKSRSEDQNRATQNIYKRNIFLSGIFAPQQPNGLTSLQLVKQYESQSNMHFSIISLYLSWGDQKQCYLPFKLLDSIYQNNAIPMITWEPWQSLFDKTKDYNATDKEKRMLSRIAKGDYDDYLDRFSKQIASLNRPVYLRFAHEADNPFYPWSVTGGNTASDFKNAWKYVYDYFKRNKVYNVIWVWNPWKASAINAYFPGKEYVDWIGVTNLNYGSHNDDKKWYTMEQLYNPFHDNPIFRSGLPVMLAEMGSLRSEGRQDEWFKGAFQSIKTKFPEIKAVVLFNNGVDKNTSVIKVNNFDWRIANMNILSSLWNKNDELLVNNRVLFNTAPGNVNPVKVDSSKAFLKDTKGINYSKGENWFKNYQTLTKEGIISDLTEIKRIGFTTIKFSGPGIYDRNIFKIAKQLNIKVNYSFSVPDDIKLISDTKQLNQFTKKIIQSVNNLKDNKSIVAWNIGNDFLQKLNLFYYKPELFYHREAYLFWLRNLVMAIKSVDPNRPVTVDVYANSDLIRVTDILHSRIPDINSFGIVINDKSTGVELINQLSVPYFYSKINARDYLDLPKTKTGIFIANWQDEETEDYITFDGLRDKWGRNKVELYQIANSWQHLPVPQQLPQIKILLPALATFANTPLTYHAIIFNKNEWALAKPGQNLNFEWELVKNDVFDNPISMKYLGTGPAITFNMPDNPSGYSLYLYVNKGSIVKIIHSKLNTPL